MVNPDYIKKTFLIIFLALLIACSSTKSKSKANESINSKDENFATQPTYSEENIASLIVSFISIGSGIDSKSKRDFLEIVQQYTSDYPDKIEYSEIFWGREGEVNYCLFLGKLNTYDQELIKNNIREMLSKSKLVRLIENAPCSK
jgi:hypothetical protein